MLTVPTQPCIEALNEEAARSERLRAQKRALRALPSAGRDEASDLVARFLASGGAVTRCAPVFLVPSQAG